MIYQQLILIVTISFKLIIGIMVLRTQSPLLETAFAEIMNSSLHNLHRFTICARFFPYQFQDTFKHHQGIISTLSTTYEDDSVLFGSITTGNCNKTGFGGCMEYYKKEIGDKWKYGRAFGWTRGQNSKSSWDRYLGFLKPLQWYGTCIAIDLTEKTYDLFIENETYSFENSFGKLNFDANILLFNVLGKEKMPFYGEITDLNVWTKEQSRIEINKFMSCEKQSSGDFLSWKSVDLNLNGVDKVEKNFFDVCRQNYREPIVVYANLAKTQEENIKFCKNIGSSVATAKNEEELKKMNDIFSKTDRNIRTVAGYFFLGFIFDVNSFVDINNKSITTNWDQHKNYSSVGKNPTCLVSEAGTVIYGDNCDFATNPMCKAKESLTDFQLRGVCLDSGADTRFIFINSTFLLGYLNTEIVFLSNETQWIIRNSTSKIALATLNNTSVFPIGKHKWHFPNINCTDTNQTHRTLFLHLDVAQPGHFCCDDGTCLDWESSVSDSVPQCAGGEDEDPCPIEKCGLDFINPGPRALPDQPIIEKKEIDGVMTLVKTEVKANVTVIDILSISETEGIFELYFVVQLMWKDVFAKYINLKDDENMNFFGENASKVIWTPSLNFFQWKPLETMEFGTRLLIQKNTSVTPILSAGMDSIYIQEVYLGSQHFLKYITKKRAQFLCQFDKIKNYPHGRQECSMGFYIKGHSNNMTDLIPEYLDLEYLEENVVIGDYILKSWRYEADTERASGEKRLKVTMILEREFLGIFMVTYFPSILMNLINQASNFISGDSRHVGWKLYSNL